MVPLQTDPRVFPRRTRSSRTDSTALSRGFQLEIVLSLEVDGRRGVVLSSGSSLAEHHLITSRKQLIRQKFLRMEAAESSILRCDHLAFD